MPKPALTPSELVHPRMPAGFDGFSEPEPMPDPVVAPQLHDVAAEFLAQPNPPGRHYRHGA